MLWQANCALENMAKTAASEPAYIAAITKDIYQLEKLTLDINRITRQYQVLRSEDAYQLVLNYFSRFRQQHEKVCTALTLPEVCQLSLKAFITLTQVVIEKEAALSAALSDLQTRFNELKNSTFMQLEQRIKSQQADIEATKTKQFWFTVILILFSLACAFFCSNKIFSPLNKLNTLIRELAHKQHKLSPVSNSGPQELIDLQNELHNLAHRLNQLENLRKAMLRHAAHELKTPLASMKEGCSLLNDNVLGSLNTQQQEVLGLLQTSSVRLEKLIGQLLNYTALLQQSKPTPQRMVVNDLLESFLTDHKLALQQNKHGIELDIQVDEIQADSVLLRRVLDNLLSNAIAYSYPNSPIFIKIYINEMEQIIECANKGKPIAYAQRECLFKPFIRGDNKRLDRISSSGLGLSIVSECVALMSGSVSFIDVDYADVCVQIVVPFPMELA